MATSTPPSLPFDQTPDPPQRHHEQLLSVKELAEYLEVPVKTIYTWRHRNTGPKGFRVGKHLRFRWHDVQAWVAERLADENCVAHIRRHPVDASKWQVRYIDPRSRERSRTFRRKVDAEKFLIHVEAQKQRAEWVDPELSSTLLKEWAAQWLATRAHLKPKTHVGYESLLRVWVLPAFGETRLDRIDRMAIERWVAKMSRAGLSPSRVRQAHQVLNAMLKAAVRNRYLAANPAQGIALPRAMPREMLFLTAPSSTRWPPRWPSRMVR